MENKENTYSQFQEEENKINLRAIIEQYLYYWKWYVLGFIIALLVAFLYLRYAQSEYQVESKILLLDDSNSLSGEMAALQDLSILSDGGKANVEDQVEVLKSRRLMME